MSDNLKMRQFHKKSIFYDLTKNCVDTVLKFRYLIALVVFIVLVLLKVNGSSIGYWSNYVAPSAKSTVVAGNAQGIRSDEWSVLTPIFLSQQNSDTPFSIINPDITLSGQNVVITLDAPVKDIYDISKPQNWGFLFLDSDHGLAWYWDMKLILIIMLSFELCMMITKRNKLISVLGTAWIALSPAVQWWFAQHVGNNVFYAEAIIVTFYYFFRYFDKIYLKILFAFLFGLSCIGFVMPFYPAIQVPFVFLCIIFIVLIITDYKKKIKIRKRDIFIIGGTAVFVLLMLAHLYLIIKSAIPLMTNTVYPGKRVSAGGSTPPFTFNMFLSNVFLPYINTQIPNENSCELSNFFNFLPGVILTFPILFRRKTVSMKYAISLAVYSVFFALFMTFSFLPNIVDKITLLSYVTGTRAAIAYGFSAMLLSIWALAELSRSGGVNRFYAILVSSAVAVSYYATVQFAGLKGIFQVRDYLIVILVFALLNYLLMRGRKWAFSAIMAVVIVVSGTTINPINIGAQAIFNNTLSKEIQQLDKSDKGAVWMAVGNQTETLGTIGILIYANGAKSIDGIDNYPDMKKWSLIDPQHKYADVYNRSAHVTSQIVTSSTKFVLEGVNAFDVNINVNDLKKLNVKYVVSNNNLTTFDNSNVNFKALFAPDSSNYTVYQITYS